MIRELRLAHGAAPAVDGRQLGELVQTYRASETVRIVRDSGGFRMSGSGPETVWVPDSAVLYVREDLPAPAIALRRGPRAG